MHLSNALRNVPWSRVVKGHFPLMDEFFSSSQSSNNNNKMVAVWPEEPLYSKLFEAMVTLQVPHLARRHPETISAILLSLLRMTSQFVKQVWQREHDREIAQEKKEDNDDEEDLHDF